MSARDIVGAVVEYYEGKLSAFGTTARGVDWKDEASQTKRFEQLLRALPLAGAASQFTILDFGCGYGALLPFLAQRGLALSYEGYDRSPRMVAEATHAHEGVAFTSDWESVGSADYVVASGVFNVRLNTPAEEWQEYVLRTLTMIHEKAGVAWAANFLTSYSDEDRKRSDLYYADPSTLFDWCKRFASRWVCLLHDYDLYEFTIGVARRPL